eukprot:TRINITY_DN2613_c0_g1_i1.p1 TRINITY_DN2613_c0_g1~~TRINITY_DN2613_c0_g1_i1.p1  ORF type:complete len:424 (+),score=72.15 TRINITY_DN2613_c0_g1_i1:91-1362(+)
MGHPTPYAAEYYDALTASEKVEVRFEPWKGKCLFAKSSFKTGDVVLAERKCVAVQNLDERIDRVPVCGYCLRSLESILANVDRVRRKMTLPKGAPERRVILASDLPYLDEQPPAKSLPCQGVIRGCFETYCSEQCRERAWQNDHAAICPLNLSPASLAGIRKFCENSWIQGGINYSDTFHVAFVIVATVMSAVKLGTKTAGEAWKPFSLFVTCPWDELKFEYLLNPEDEPEEEDQVSKEALLKEASEILKTIHQPAPDALFLFEPETISNLLGMILLNGQERTPPSPFLAYKNWLTATHPEVKVDDLVKNLCAPEHNDSNEDLLNYSSRGQGIYAIGACMNHSCEPNVCVSYNSDNDETLYVTALRDIEADEELFISYIDEDGEYSHRQTQLFNHYRFHCACPKCIKEGEAQLQRGGANIASH